MSAFPKYVYKIVPEAPPSPLPSTLALSALDSKDGFIHLSIGSQVPITAGLFFNDVSSVWVLRVDRDALEREGGVLKWLEDRPETGCVHLYGRSSEAHDWDGARLGQGNVVESIELKRTESQTWAEASGGDTWLVNEV
ncbi:hypothetical protein CYLTODRAFT_420073 [Cylindrobasidium torrendii FP15055 ss-10]|uniref:DUF952-domain-containing protein n=1 Tax=Cylindrobasidium torrendii FP15055 ss-10 TaxID=1314674 RepID=A0A0D7BJ26_9AGAR|nr:hypothetical protein CYLTODRAFT_420073 [Cylindrobasidium torrendii FP15055 ss-10]